jgi:hypothetical protein
VRLPLNLRALVPFLNFKDVARSTLLRKGSGNVKHAGGGVLTAEDRKAVLGFLNDAPSPFFDAVPLARKRPSYQATAESLALGTEIALRRLFLDLLGRPPTVEELARHGDSTLKEVVRSLVSSDRYDRYWKGDVAGPLKDVWNEEIVVTVPVREVVTRLAAFYETMLERRTPRRKTIAQQAASFLVDLWGVSPSAEEQVLIAGALEALAGDRLPLALFMVGAVKCAAKGKRKRWIEGAYVRFLLRRPSKPEIEAAEKLLERTGGARILILGLASSEDYAAY